MTDAGKNNLQRVISEFIGKHDAHDLVFPFLRTLRITRGTHSLDPQLGVVIVL